MNKKQPQNHGQKSKQQLKGANVELLQLNPLQKAKSKESQLNLFKKVQIRALQKKPLMMINEGSQCEE
jgi:hypothetical protein